MEIPRHWRVKGERYRLAIDFKKTGGAVDFPPRPLPVGANDQIRRRAIEAQAGNAKQELRRLTARMYQDQLKEGVITQSEYGFLTNQNKGTIVIFSSREASMSSR